MDFTTSDDRQMLAEALRRLLADTWDPETRATAAYTTPYHLPTAWKALAEMGVLAAMVDEDHGGFGGTGLDLLAIFTEVGRATCPEPLLATLLALRLLSSVDAGDDLETVMAGTRAVVAFAEPDDPDAVHDLATTAHGGGGGWRVTGRKSVVHGGPGADLLVVTAMADDVMVLLAVDPSDAAMHDYGLIDGGGASEVVLEDTPARLLGTDVGGALDAALDAGRVALCAEAVGAMDRLVDMTTDHLGARKQFGRPLASFQALQHRVVDLSLEREQARSITIRAAADLDTPAGPRSVALAKHLVGHCARKVAEESIQLHGGIGMTWEYPGAHVAKRLVMLDAQLGDSDHQVQRVVAMDAADA